MPSDTFLGHAGGSNIISLELKPISKSHESPFVGRWAPPFPLPVVYNKLVKQFGSDRKANKLRSGLINGFGSHDWPYLMQKSRHSGYYEKIAQNLVLYREHTRHLVGVLHDNAKELYRIFGKILDVLVAKRLRNTYDAVKAEMPISFFAITSTSN